MNMFNIYIVVAFFIIVIIGLIMYYLIEKNRLENFTTSVDLYKDPAVSDFAAKYNLLGPVLSDSKEMLIMNSCVMMDKTFFDTLSAFPSKADYYSHYFQTLLNNSTGSTFIQIQEQIKAEIYALYNQINLNSHITLQLPEPVYALIFQAPNYPEISMLNWQIGTTGFDYLPYNVSTFGQNATPNIMVSVLLLFPKCTKDGTPINNLTEKEVVEKLAPIFKNISKDQLCFIQCLNNPNLACGCSSQTVNTADGSSTLYSSKCLSSEGDGGDIVNYGIVYQINPQFADFLKDNIFSNTSIKLVDEPLFQYPPPNIAEGQNWSKDSSDSVLSKIDNISYARYKTQLNDSKYGKGQYIAWANSIYNYDQANEIRPPGAFDSKPPAWNGQPNNHFWHVNGSAMYTNKTDAKIPPFLAIELPSEVVLRQYSLQPRGDCCAQQVPTVFKIYGSNKPKDDSSWTLIDSQTGIVWSSTSQVKKFITSNSRAFKAYKIECLRNGDPNPDNLHIGKWRLFAQPTN